MTQDCYMKMLDLQNQCCLICNINVENTGKLHLVIDHCHKTNKVRGLLCSKCNVGLGMFNDDIEILKSAINYLEN